MQPKPLSNLLLCLIFMCTTLHIQAQRMLYHRIEANIPLDVFQKIMTDGLEIDHFEYKNLVLKAEVSENDIKLLRKYKVKIKYVLKDVEKNIEAYNAKVDKKAAKTSSTNRITVATPVNFGTGGSYGSASGPTRHFTFDEMQAELDEMRALYPNLITVKSSLGTTDQGRNLFMVRLSDNADTDESEPEVYLNAVHHAREPLSMTQLIFFMWHLLENYNTDKEIQTLVNSTELYIVPCVNPDGYVYNYTQNSSGGSMWRKNRHVNTDNSIGVDNNRNYGFNWGGSGSSTTPGSDTYRGSAPFSEKENTILKNFCNSRQFITQFNYHTYSNVLIYPYSYITPNNNPEVPLFNQLSAFLTEDNNYPYGNCYQMLNYLASGCAEDWGYGEQTTKGKIYGFTPEFGTSSDGFYPAASRIIPLCNEAIVMNKNLMKVSTKYAEVTTNQAATFTSTMASIPFSLKNYSILPASYTITLTPLSAIVITSDAPITISSSVLFQVQNNVFNFAIDQSTPYGTSVPFEISTNNGYHTRKDTISMLYTCAAPGNLSSTSITTNSATVQWNSVDGSTDYYLSTKLNTSSTWDADILISGATNYTLSALSSNTTYNWRVRTLDCSEYSAPQNFTTQIICGVPNPVAGNVTTGSFTLSWPAVPGATVYTVQTRLQGAATWNTTTTAATTLTINGLNAGNIYEYQVSATCPSGNGNYSAVGTIRTNTFNYCTSYGINNTKEWIDFIQLSSIARTSGAEPGGYKQTGLSSTLSVGTAYTVTFSAGFSASVIKENWKMFIDYNADGDFNDGGETIVNTSKTGAGNFTATFTVPVNAKLKNTVLRVKMSPKGISNACNSFNNGEVEDYLISIVNPVNVTGTTKTDTDITRYNLKDVRVQQNPFKDNINIHLNGKFAKPITITIIDISGKIVYTSQVVKTTTYHRINASAFSSGIYMLNIQSGNEKKTFKLVK